MGASHRAVPKQGTQTHTDVHALMVTNGEPLLSPKQGPWNLSPCPRPVGRVWVVFPWRRARRGQLEAPGTRAGALVPRATRSWGKQLAPHAAPPWALPSLAVGVQHAPRMHTCTHSPASLPAPGINRPLPTAPLTLFSRGLFRPQLFLSLCPPLFPLHLCSVSFYLCPHSCSHLNLHPTPFPSLFPIPHPSPSHPNLHSHPYPFLHPISSHVSYSRSILIPDLTPISIPDHYYHCSHPHSIPTPATLHSPQLREPHTLPTSPAWAAGPNPQGRLLLLAQRLPVFISELTAAELQSHDAAG